MTVRLEGDEIVAVVTDAVALLRRVWAGQWSAAVDVTEDRFQDPTAARAELDELAVGMTVSLSDALVVSAQPDGAVQVDGDQAVLMQALDLYMRVLMGQFNEVARVCDQWDLGSVCDQVRFMHQRGGAWPGHPHTYWGIHSSQTSPRAVLAYDAWKLLGGGMRERGPITGKVRVTVI
jgi:hypothetical protein